MRPQARGADAMRKMTLHASFGRLLRRTRESVGTGDRGLAACGWRACHTVRGVNAGRPCDNPPTVSQNCNKDVTKGSGPGI